MEFQLNEEQSKLQSAARELARKEIGPAAAAVDEAEEFAMDNFKKMAALGFTGLLIPPQYGGIGGDMVGTVAVMEEIAQACASTADILNAHLILGARPVLLNGTAEQKKKYLPPLASGSKIGAFAITEADAGSDISGAKSTAVKEGDSYVINGCKVFITNGPACDIMIIFAGIPALAPRGMTAFIVESSAPGFSRSTPYVKVGMHGGTNCKLIFENARIPASDRLGDEGKGMKICLYTLDEGRICIAAQAVGIGQAVLDHAVAHAKERRQFGRPIGDNQAIQWKLVDMDLKVQAARLLTYHAASLLDNKLSFSREAARAKLFASDSSMEIAVDGMQVCGGYGYMMDSPMQRYFRDAKLTQIYEGTSEVQRMVISRALLTA